MERLVGTISRGVRAPIIRQGDDLAQIVVDSVLAASKSEGFSLHDRDVVAVTEAVVARAQGNYAHIDQIAADVRAKLGGETVGVKENRADAQLPRRRGRQPPDRRRPAR